MSSRERAGLRKDLVGKPVLSEEFDHQLHRNPRACRDRLSVEDVRRHFDAFLPGPWDCVGSGDGLDAEALPATLAVVGIGNALWAPHDFDSLALTVFSSAASWRG